MIGIYQIQSKEKPNRIYIGSAVNIKERWRNHLKTLRKNKHHSIKLQRHYNKYGEDDLCFLILVSCDKDELLIYEQYYLDSLTTYFNTCKKAGSVLGLTWTVSDETKAKISKIKKGQIPWNKGRKGVYSPESLKKIQMNRTKPDQRGDKNSMYGQKHSEETKSKIRAKALGRKVSDEVKKKMSLRMSGKNNPHYGKKHSEETKNKIRNTHLGLRPGIKTRLKMRKSAKNRKRKVA